MTSHGRYQDGLLHKYTVNDNRFSRYLFFGWCRVPGRQNRHEDTEHHVSERIQNRRPWEVGAQLDVSRWYLSSPNPSAPPKLVLPLEKHAPYTCWTENRTFSSEVQSRDGTGTHATIRAVRTRLQRAAARSVFCVKNSWSRWCVCSFKDAVVRSCSRGGYTAVPSLLWGAQQDGY